MYDNLERKNKFTLFTGIILILTGLYSTAMGASQYYNLSDFPAIGKGMLNSEGEPANWLNQRYQDKELLEPINIIIIDKKATTPEEAKSQLRASVLRAGYDSRMGHSSGYKGLINNKQYEQLPEEPNHAFSDHFFIFPNNHGRIFGPHYYEGKYYFIAAFSREGIDIFAKVKHVYDSFTVARDDFAERLSGNSEYRITGEVDLGNRIMLDSSQTTGDHDGMAIVLIRE